MTPDPSTIVVPAGTLAGLAAHFPRVDPVVFHRSACNAPSPGVLFDLLHGPPAEFPVMFDHGRRTWRKLTDPTRRGHIPATLESER